MPSDGPVTGDWSRAKVESSPTKDGKQVDWNRTAGLTRVTLPEDQASKISASNPRTCGLVVNGPYTPDSGGVDRYTTSFLQGQGDCDSKVISAMDVCYTYLHKDWIPFMALGYAWLDSGKDGIKKIAHAYVVYVSRRDGTTVTDEMTYLKKNDRDVDNPGSSHIISCEWLIGPDYVIRVGKTHNLAVDGQVENGRLALKYKGSKIGFGKFNDPLETDIQRAVGPRLPEIVAAYESYSSEGKPLVLETKGHNEYGREIMGRADETVRVAQ